MTDPEPTPATDPTPSGKGLSAVDPAVATKKFMRRRQIIAAVLLAVSALAFWSASRLVWCTVLAADGLAPARDFTVHGSDWSPWLTPLALVLLAAILAALSLRGWGLRLIAILIAVAGVVAAIPAISLLTSSANADYAARAANLPGRFQVLLITTNPWAAVVVLVGAACAVAAGVFLMRVAGGTGMSSKYTTPGARRDELERQIFAEHELRKNATSDAASASGSGETGAPANERMMWDALDTGIDPTAPDPTAPDPTAPDPTAPDQVGPDDKDR